MRKLFLTGCLLLAAVVTFAIEIRGKLVGYNGETVLVKAGKVDTLKVANDGSFVYRCKAEQPYTEVSFFRFGKDPVIMRLNDDDCVQLEAVKGADEHVNVKFSGDRKALNHYLTYYELRNGFEQWPMEKIAGMPFKQHAAAVDAMEAELNALLDEAKEDTQLIEDLRHKQHSAMLGLKQRYCWAVRAINKEPMDNDADYVRFARALDMNDEAWLEKDKNEHMSGYPNLLDGRIRWEVAVNKDSRNANGLSTAAYIEWTRKLVDSDKVADYLITKSMKMYLEMGGNDELDETYRTFLKYSTDSEAKKELASKYKELTELAPGKLAPDFEMKDTDGKIYKLSDLRGKVLYIDVWATWCGPCVGEIPYFEKKHEQYKNNTDIEFISISADANVSAWKKKLAEDNPSWKQFIVDKGTKSALFKLYGINGIPRFMLIDKDGKIITVNAPRPSDDKINTYLNKLSK